MAFCRQGAPKRIDSGVIPISPGSQATVTVVLGKRKEAEMDPVGIRLTLEGHGATEQTTFDLQDWLQRESIPGMTVQRARRPARPGEMGGFDPTSLSVQLGQEAVREGVKGLFGSIQTWLKTRKADLTVVARNGERSVEVKLKNLNDPSEVVKIVRQLTENI